MSEDSVETRNQRRAEAERRLEQELGGWVAEEESLRRVHEVLTAATPWSDKQAALDAVARSILEASEAASYVDAWNDSASRRAHDFLPAHLVGLEARVAGADPSPRGAFVLQRAQASLLAWKLAYARMLGVDDTELEHAVHALDPRLFESHEWAGISATDEDSRSLLLGTASATRTLAWAAGWSDRLDLSDDALFAVCVRDDTTPREPPVLEEALAEQLEAACYRVVAGAEGVSARVLRWVLEPQWPEARFTPRGREAPWEVHPDVQDIGVWEWLAAAVFDDAPGNWGRRRELAERRLRRGGREHPIANAWLQLVATRPCPPRAFVLAGLRDLMRTGRPVLRRAEQVLDRAVSGALALPIVPLLERPTAALSDRIREWFAYDGDLGGGSIAENGLSVALQTRRDPSAFAVRIEQQSAAFGVWFWALGMHENIAPSRSKLLALARTVTDDTLDEATLRPEAELRACQAELPGGGLEWRALRWVLEGHWPDIELTPAAD